MLNLLLDTLKVVLNPKKISEVDSSPITLGKTIGYVFIVSLIGVILGQSLPYGELRMRTEMTISVVLFSIIYVPILIKIVAYVTRKESDLVTESKVAKIVLTALTIPTMAEIFLILPLLIGLLLIVLAAIYAIYLVYNGYLHFIKAEKKTALTGTLWFVGVNMLTGFIINTIMMIYYYGI